MLSHGVIFNPTHIKVCSPAIIETYFSYDKDIYIAITYYMYFYLIVLFLLVAILQLINFTASYITDIFTLLILLSQLTLFVALHNWHCLPWSLYCFTFSISCGVENYFPVCGLRASPMLFCLLVLIGMNMFHT